MSLFQNHEFRKKKKNLKFEGDSHQSKEKE